MSACNLLKSAQAAGVRLSLNGNKIKVRADHELPVELIESLRAHKGELLAELNKGQTSADERKPKALPAGVSRAYTRLGHTLAENPGMRFACENLPDEGGDSVLMAVGVKGAGYAVLRMPRKRFDGFRLIEMVARWNHQ